MVKQLFRKKEIVGSIPIFGSIRKYMAHWCYECGGKGKTYVPQFVVRKFTPFANFCKFYVRCETCKGTGIITDKIKDIKGMGGN